MLVMRLVAGCCEAFCPVSARGREQGATCSDSNGIPILHVVVALRPRLRHSRYNVVPNDANIKTNISTSRNLGRVEVFLDVGHA